jgi:hypothetical protein
MTDTAAYLAEALNEIARVTSEASLMGWHDCWCNSLEYLQLTDDEARQLEDAYQRKAGWFMGVGAG